MSKDKDGHTFDEKEKSSEHSALFPGEERAPGDEDGGPRLSDADSFETVLYTDADDLSGDYALAGDSASSGAAPAGGFDAPRRADGRQMGAASRRLRGQGARHLRHRASLDWRHDQQRVCQKGHDGADIESLAKLTETLLQSRTASALYERVEAEGVSIVHDRQTPTSQYYPRSGAAGPAHVISLNPYHPRGTLLNMLARELRRAWQAAEGALLNPLSFEPDEAILINRAQQADVLMISIKIAWELRLAGMPEAWNDLVGSPVADVTALFEDKARDFRTLNNGEAARAAYDKFFENSCIRIHDKRVIHQMLLDESGYIKSKAPRRQVDMDVFRRLGRLPHGRNYLAVSKARLPVDPAYAMVEDRSNANFLWFIKFERSFQEKEQQMIQDSVRLSAEVVELAQWTARRKKTPGKSRPTVDA